MSEPGIEVPPLRGTPPAGAVRARRRIAAGPAMATRRSVLGGLIASGTALGITALGVFPAARKAYAEGYDIYTGPCPSYARDHDCSPGCGPSAVFLDACETAGPATGFHRDDGRDWILRPNACLPGGWDGWLWFYDGACGMCACFIERRCHDGFRRTDSGWVNSICRWDTQCGCPDPPPEPDPPPAPPPPAEWPTVGPGEQGPDVFTIQHLLNHRAVPSEVTGSYGLLTGTSVRVFQTTRFIRPSGVVDPATWLALVVPVGRGNRGGAVVAALHQLAAHGLDVGFDGAFGEAAEQATLAFQRRAALPVTGVIDEATWRALTAG